MENLPTEVLAGIFARLEPRELLALAQTCDRFDAIIRGDAKLRRKLEWFEQLMKKLERFRAPT